LFYIFRGIGLAVAGCFTVFLAPEDALSAVKLEFGDVLYFKTFPLGRAF
jgi:hypothetical protein